MNITLNIKIFITAICAIILFNISITASACELNNFQFGSSIKSAKQKYNFKDDIFGGKYFEMNLRAKDICDEYKNGTATLIFFEKKLVQVQISITTNSTILYDEIIKHFGDMIITPNFKEIKNTPFATTVDSENYNVNYLYHKQNNIIHETIRISPKDATKSLNEFIAETEFRKDNRR